MRHRTLALSFAGIFLCGPALADVIHVPADQPTIQAGINAAVNGDTVLVASGVYSGPGNVNITFNGKQITVESAGGAEDCVIDAQGLGRGFLFDDGETPASVLRGFTIRNGVAPGFFPNNSGGGIYLNGGSPTIEHNIITDNVAGWGGGGIHVQNASPVIQDNWVVANTGGYAGGIGVVGSSALISRNVIRQNQASSFDGGGVYLRNASGTALISNFIAENTTNWNGGGVFLIGSSPLMANNVIVYNTANDDGGGIYGQNGSSPDLSNNTIAFNAASRGGGMGLRLLSRPVGVNMILWGNSPTEVLTEIGSSLSLTFSDVSGGYPGAGNIDTDPLFVNPALFDFHIQNGSPAIRAGTAGSSVLSFDIDGDPRPSPAGTDPDMGADENPN